MSNKNDKYTLIDYEWDQNCTSVPEDGYDIEEDLNFVIGEQVMFKKDFQRVVNKLMMKLYQKIKHGDKAHRDWLKKEIKKFCKDLKPYSQHYKEDK